MGLLSLVRRDVAGKQTRRRNRASYIGWAGLLTANYAGLLTGAAISSIPLIWMISTSLKEHGKEFLSPPQWIPNPALWENYSQVWLETNFEFYFLNSVIVSVLATVGTLLSCSIVAFGFARFDFFGKNPLFMLVLSTLMLPGIVTLVPTFILFRHLGWIDTFAPLIVPFWFGGGASGGAFFVFLMRQFMLQLPRELDEAALVDGASWPRIYWSVIMPLMGPALAATAIFSFIHHWNDFLHPLIFLISERWRTLALGLRYFLYEEGSGGYGDSHWNLLMAASVAMVIPILIIFFSAQKYFIRGIALSGLTGR